MNIEEYRGWFIAGSLALMLLVASPALATFIHISNNSEGFSELWVFGPNHTVEDYPLVVKANEQNNIFIGVRNHLGYSAYYDVRLKFRNQTQSYPDNEQPSSLASVCEFYLFLANGNENEISIMFSISNVSLVGETTSVGRLVVNNQSYSSNSIAKWDSKYQGFFYEVLFELWLYDIEVNDFKYNDRYVGIWLNVQ